MKRKHKLWLGLLIVLTVVSTSFGYAALNTELSISGEGYVRVNEGIRITNLSLSSITAGGYETYNNKYTKDTTSMFVTLPPNGTATYEIEITNKNSEDYFLKSITDNPNYELLDSEVYDVFTGNSTKKIHVKITNTKGTTENIALNLEYEFQKDEKPTITLADLPSWNTKGDDYIVKPEYTSITGGTAKCKSNLEPTIENVTDLKDLTTTGTHNITCTVTSNTGKSASVTKSTKITYDPYNTKNILANSSFESGTTSWIGLNTEFGISSSISKYGSKSGYIKRIAKDVHAVQSYNLIKGHHYYAMEWVYLSSSFSGNGQFDLFRTAGTAPGYPEYINIDFKGLTPLTWHRLSGTFISEVSHPYYFRAGYLLDGNTTAYFDGTTFIDLTATFGAGLEPDKKWCDKHIEYFAGTTIIYK